MRNWKWENSQNTCSAFWVSFNEELKDRPTAFFKLIPCSVSFNEELKDKNPRSSSSESAVSFNEELKEPLFSNLSQVFFVSFNEELKDCPECNRSERISLLVSFNEELKGYRRKHDFRCNGLWYPLMRNWKFWACMFFCARLRSWYPLMRNWKSSSSSLTLFRMDCIL